MIDYENLAKICNEEFEPIKNKYGFEDFYPCGTKYTPKAFAKNETTGILFEYEMRENCISEFLYRLPEGDFEPTRKDGTRINSNEFYDILDLLSLRNSTESDSNNSTGFIDESLNKTINSYLEITLRHAEDILCGDFSVFAELKKIVIARAKKYGVQLRRT
ncbi:hypothetical protein [Gimesia aquarii]|uniref:Uncharacterized protein n=1 Tax=Gimesia aquarii TaxID=2527964 RepID=A0A517WSE2_9PLAN|nr:hypothetical protein [Gimesia aquarii]QDU08175.1 hypothetical protein V202x_15390 [Gimesia aquarii]